MQILNPAAKQMREAEVKALAARKVTRVAALKQKRSKAGRKEKAVRCARFNAVETGLEDAFMLPTRSLSMSLRLVSTTLSLRTKRRKTSDPIGYRL